MSMSEGVGGGPESVLIGASQAVGGWVGTFLPGAELSPEQPYWGNW